MANGKGSLGHQNQKGCHESYDRAWILEQHERQCAASAAACNEGKNNGKKNNRMLKQPFVGCQPIS